MLCVLCCFILLCHGTILCVTVFVRFSCTVHCYLLFCVFLVMYVYLTVYMVPYNTATECKPNRSQYTYLPIYLSIYLSIYLPTYLNCVNGGCPASNGVRAWCSSFSCNTRCRYGHDRQHAGPWTMPWPTLTRLYETERESSRRMPLFQSCVISESISHFLQNNLRPPHGENICSATT